MKNKQNKSSKKQQSKSTRKVCCHHCGQEKRLIKSDRYFNDKGERRVELQCVNPQCQFGVIESDHVHIFNRGPQPFFHWWKPRTERWECCKICGKYSGARCE